jgi:hypothetical protein
MFVARHSDGTSTDHPRNELPSTLPRGFGASIAATGGPHLAVAVFFLHQLHRDHRAYHGVRERDGCEIGVGCSLSRRYIKNLNTALKKDGRDVKRVRAK